MTSLSLEVFAYHATQRALSPATLSAASEYVRVRSMVTIPTYTAQILDDAFIRGLGMEALEEKYEWSKGAAKNILRVLLISVFCADGTPESVEVYEPVEDPDDLGALMLHYRFTGSEAAVFKILHDRRNRAVSREFISDTVFGYEALDSSVRTTIHHVRRKLAVMKYNGTIETIRGYGYVLQTISDRPSASLLPKPTAAT